MGKASLLISPRGHSFYSMARKVSWAITTPKHRIGDAGYNILIKLNLQMKLHIWCCLNSLMNTWMSTHGSPVQNHQVSWYTQWITSQFQSKESPSMNVRIGLRMQSFVYFFLDLFQLAKARDWSSNYVWDSHNRTLILRTKGLHVTTLCIYGIIGLDKDFASHKKN